MKYLYFIFALLTITTSCELRTTNFDPDNQLLSDDELAKVAVWDHLDSEQLSSALDYESINIDEFVFAEFSFRQNSMGIWVIEGSLRSFATEAHFQVDQLIVSYFDKSNVLVGTEYQSVYDYLAPGDSEGFYFKSEKFKDAHFLTVEIDQVKSVRP